MANIGVETFQSHLLKLGYRHIATKDPYHRYQRCKTAVTVELTFDERDLHFSMKHYQRFPTPKEIKERIQTEKEKPFYDRIQALTQWLEETSTDEELVEDEKIEGIPDLPHKKDRRLIIYVWGMACRKWPPDQLGVTKDNNFNAAVLHDHKKADRSYSARESPEVVDAVRRGKGFWEFLTGVIRKIEEKDFVLIGVNCRKGRHRSQTVALTLKEFYYPNAEIFYLEKDA